MTATRIQEEEEYTARFSLAVWRKLLGYVRPYRGHVAALVVAAGLLAAGEAGFMLMTRYVIDDAADGGSFALATYAVGYAVIALLFALDVMWFIRLAGRISTSLSHDVRQAAFDHLQDLSFSFFDRRPAGWLVARLTSDCDRFSRTVAWGCLDVVWGGMMVAAVAVIMLATHWQLGLLVLIVLPAMACVSLVFQKRILHASRAVRKSNSAITAAYNECITGVRTTKTLVREAENLREFQSTTEGMHDHSVRSAVLTAAYFPCVLTLAGVGVGLTLWVGGGEAVAGRLSIGKLVLFVNCVGMLIWPILEMARVFADLQGSQAAAERVLGLIDTPPDVRDTPEALAAIAAAVADGPRANLAVDGMAERIGQVRFRGVCFAYERDRPVLTDFDLAVHAGQTVALVGPTGGGKTTVVSLLARFYEPTAGEILLDGTEYRRRSLHWLQSHLGIVLQQPHLFSGTVADNIRYGRLDATDEQIVEAARLVRAHEFIATLPGGYDTQVGQGGGNLSTGQKQLVSFARAVLADPQIFIMDEATSSVDTETERRIQQGLGAVLAGRISFIIAHRLSTICGADVILLIDGGRVIEQGSHHELIGHKGRYHQLYTQQFTEEKSGQILAPWEDDSA